MKQWRGRVGTGPEVEEGMTWPVSSQMDCFTANYHVGEYHTQCLMSHEIFPSGHCEERWEG